MSAFRGLNRERRGLLSGKGLALLFAALMLSGCGAGLFQGRSERNGGEGGKSGDTDKRRCGSIKRHKLKGPSEGRLKCGPGKGKGREHRKPLPCLSDSDCALADAKGCCGCSMGGRPIAVHKSRIEKYREKLKEYRERECRSQVCKAHYRCNSFKAQCVESQCQAVPANNP